jgi:tetratricopeptide (TPR) repeat protein
MPEAIRKRFVVLVVLLACTGIVRAAPEDELKQQALKFNSVVIIGEDDRERAKFVDKQLEPFKQDAEKGKKLLAVAVKMAQEKEQPFNFTGAFILGSLARELKDVEAAKTLLSIALDKAEKLQSDQKYISATFELLDLYTENKLYERAERLCKEFMEKPVGQESSRYKVQALRRMIQVTAMQGKPEQAHKLLEPFLKAAADDPQVMDLQAWIFRYEGKYTDAARIYDKLLKAVDREEAKDFVHYMLSNLYADMNDVDKATEHLEPLLKKKPDNATYNNDLGYIWADHGKNLDEAEKMIKKAVDADPDNAAYLDSYAWVLFKKKQYREAKEQMLKAL